MLEELWNRLCNSATLLSFVVVVFGIKAHASPTVNLSEVKLILDQDNIMRVEHKMVVEFGREQEDYILRFALPNNIGSTAAYQDILLKEDGAYKAYDVTMEQGSIIISARARPGLNEYTLHYKVTGWKDIDTLVYSVQNVQPYIPIKHFLFEFILPNGTTTSKQVVKSFIDGKKTYSLVSQEQAADGWLVHSTKPLREEETVNLSISFVKTNEYTTNYHENNYLDLFDNFRKNAKWSAFWHSLMNKLGLFAMFVYPLPLILLSTTVCRKSSDRQAKSKHNLKKVKQLVN